MPKKTKRTDFRTTVSFAPEIWEIIQEQMKLRGFNNNISAYFSDAARRDRERTIEIELAALELSTQKPGTQTALTTSQSIARRIIQDVVRRARSRGPRASDFDLLVTGESPARVIQGFSPRPPIERPKDASIPLRAFHQVVPAVE